MLRNVKWYAVITPLKSHRAWLVVWNHSAFMETLVNILSEGQQSSARVRRLGGIAQWDGFTDYLGHYNRDKEKQFHSNSLLYLAENANVKQTFWDRWKKIVSGGCNFTPWKQKAMIRVNSSTSCDPLHACHSVVQSTSSPHFPSIPYLTSLWLCWAPYHGLCGHYFMSSG